MIARLCRYYRSNDNHIDESNELPHRTRCNIFAKGVSSELCKRPDILSSVVSTIKHLEHLENNRYRSMEDSISNNYHEHNSSRPRTNSTKPRNGFRRYAKRHY
jgi:hypothetical protein